MTTTCHGWAGYYKPLSPLSPTHDPGGNLREKVAVFYHYKQFCSLFCNWLAYAKMELN